MVSKHAVLRTAIPAELREWVDNRLINAHVRIVRIMVVGCLLNAAAICLALAGEVENWLLGLFACMMVMASLHRLWLAEGIERGRRQRRSAKIMNAYALSSLWLGLTMGIACALFFAQVSHGDQLLLATSGVAQIAAAAYTMRTLVRSAVIFIAAQASGLIIGLAQLGEFDELAAIVVVLVASGLLIRMTFMARDLFVTRILADRELAATTRTVKLLLNEYQESGSDWLFELDSQRRIVGACKRFASAAGQTAEQLEGAAFLSLFAADGARSALSSAIVERRPIRSVIVALGNPVEGEARWWSISGRPCHLGEGVVYRGVISDITERRHAEHRAQHMAHFDTLTGLPNRTLFDSGLESLVSTRKRGEHIALLLLDVDHFKSINDMHGHPVGDAFLCALGQRLTDCVQTSGLGGSHPLIARLGGDEFAIVVSGDDAPDHAVRLAGCLLSAMAEPFQIDRHELHSGVSIGIALAPFHAGSKEQLVSYADMALHAAKERGRGDWEMFEPDMDAQLHERHTLARDLRHAVARGELRLFLQPLVDATSEARTGYEALLRWQHPERGLVSPDRFIPIAEETGLIVPIGEWVIRTALHEAARWQDGETIAINLSPVQIQSAGLLQLVVSALAESGVAPGRVEFEITESVLLENSQANLDVLKRLQSLGVKIALDDFGTGHASLNYLLTFPFDKIKIDRSFVSDLATREESRAIVGAVIALANQLGMCTLAEGVEERVQLEQLRHDGCRMVQGWLFGKALPSEDYHPRMATPAKRRKPAQTQTYSARKRA